MSQATVKVSRRAFLKYSGITTAGLILGAAVPVSARIMAGANPATTEHELNLFVSISPDNTVHIICHRSEMGQGIRTGIPQIVADELGADWKQVKVVQGLANKAYGSQNTDGSRSIRNFFTTMREMGATARMMLEQAAADVWTVDTKQVYTKENYVYLKGQDKKLSFGELAELAAKVTPPAKDTLVFKSRKDFTLIGKSVPNVDLPDVLAGSTVFGQDIKLDGMLYASIERSPVVGAKVKQFNKTAALNTPGVKQVVTMPEQPLPVVFHPLNGVAVLADNTWSALQGRKQLNIEWELGDNQSHNSVKYLKSLVDKNQNKGNVIRQTGDAYAKLADASTTIKADYTMPYLVHAPMEPPAATAVVSEGQCEIWACTQTPQSTQANVANALGIEPDKVKVNVTLLGGAFGRKSKPDFSVEAALLAKESGKPVKVVWSREDDIQNGYYHAISAQHFEAGLDKDGSVMAWTQRTAFPSIGWTFDHKVDAPAGFETDLGFADMPLDIPHLSCETHKATAHVRIGWVRSVSNIQHGFALGSFVDELAHATSTPTHKMWHQLLGKDRLIDTAEQGYKYGNYGSALEEYPIDTKRIKAVLDLVVEKAGANDSLPAGQGWGISVHRSFVSYVAVATKVSVKDGQVKVLEMHTAIDAGTVVNPDRVHAQMEGSMIFGLSLALMGDISVKDGAVQQSNFHNHPMLRINQCPVIKTYIVPSTAPAGGVGEPGVPPVAASLANAIFKASNKRIRDLPVSKHFKV
ncbi:xanthine dehydrogenase family protein molybdopterin-binding subunit [Agaribacter flavus]|uniref:Molybdopterin cofactor-binding domain-containing protein n=1 Tax=Agaribacter flavus TaxID=1902781 RepID=A0ABV7FRK2_9ALTE